MNRFNVFIKNKNRLLLKAGYLNIFWKSDIEKSDIIISDISDTSGFDLSYFEDFINIILVYDNVEFDNIYTKVELKNFNRDNGEILLKSDFNPDSLNYSQILIDTLCKEDVNIDWFFFNLTEKIALIRSFLIKNGLPETINTNCNISIDCESLADYIDIYYFLSQALLGPHKYLGTGLDSFEDCLIGLKLKLKNSNIVIYFVNKRKINEPDVENELNEVITILRQYFITVVLQN